MSKQKQVPRNIDEDDCWNFLQSELRSKRKLKTFRDRKVFTAWIADKNCIYCMPENSNKDFPYSLSRKLLGHTINKFNELDGNPKFWTISYNQKLNGASYMLALILYYLNNKYV